MYRGGNWNNGANAGVFYLNGNNSRSNVNTNIGFRAALALFVYFLRAKAQQKHQIHARAALPVEATGDTEQTAQAGRCLLCGQKGGSGSCGVATAEERSRRGMSQRGP